MASEFNADDILEVSTSGYKSCPTSGPMIVLTSGPVLVQLLVQGSVPLPVLLSVPFPVSLPFSHLILLLVVLFGITYFYRFFAIKSETSVGNIFFP